MSMGQLFQLGQGLFPAPYLQALQTGAFPFANFGGVQQPAAPGHGVSGAAQRGGVSLGVGCPSLLDWARQEAARVASGAKQTPRDFCSLSGAGSAAAAATRPHRSAPAAAAALPRPTAAQGDVFSLRPELINGLLAQMLGPDSAPAPGQGKESKQGRRGGQRPAPEELPQKRPRKERGPPTHEAFYNGKWYPCWVVQIAEDGTYEVDWDGPGEQYSVGLPPENVRDFVEEAKPVVFVMADPAPPKHMITKVQPSPQPAPRQEYYDDFVPMPAPRHYPVLRRVAPKQPAPNSAGEPGAGRGRGRGGALPPPTAATVAMPPPGSGRQERRACVFVAARCNLELRPGDCAKCGQPGHDAEQCGGAGPDRPVLGGAAGGVLPAPQRAAPPELPVQSPPAGAEQERSAGRGRGRGVQGAAPEPAHGRGRGRRPRGRNQPGPRGGQRRGRGRGRGSGEPGPEADAGEPEQEEAPAAGRAEEQGELGEDAQWGAAEAELQAAPEGGAGADISPSEGAEEEGADEMGTEEEGYDAEMSLLQQYLGGD
eukprot:TRINITY_DN5915_c0_g2_i2.p1 TRINITY_DN5915_c0_g2~~TRINITY_DN5915_c0_g2_i2.p1  ORF type:complete len:575 (+),score=146.25 TRINITY_DN5915_c0_g2_i2:110-1726(+)